MFALGGKADKASKVASGKVPPSARKKAGSFDVFALHGPIKLSSFGGLLGVFEIPRGVTFSRNAR